MLLISVFAQVDDPKNVVSLKNFLHKKQTNFCGCQKPPIYAEQKQERKSRAKCFFAITQYRTHIPVICVGKNHLWFSVENPPPFHKKSSMVLCQKSTTITSKIILGVERHHRKSLKSKKMPGSNKFPHFPILFLTN